MHQQEDELTAGDEVYWVQGRNKHCAFARDTEAKLQLLCSLEPCMKMHAMIILLPDRDKGRRRHKAHASHATLSTDACQLTDSTPSSKCFLLDDVI